MDWTELLNNENDETEEEIEETIEKARNMLKLVLDGAGRVDWYKTVGIERSTPKRVKRKTTPPKRESPNSDGLHAFSMRLIKGLEQKKASQPFINKHKASDNPLSFFWASTQSI